MTLDSETCHCGQPLHYVDPVLQRYMEKLVAENGRYIKITIQGKDGSHAWMVDRHYVALHGTIGKDIASLGFEEVEP